MANPVSLRPQTLTVTYGEFETPSSRGTVSGVYSPRNTALDVKFETGALESYRDFINQIQGAAPNSPDAVKDIAGSATWDGKIAGPSENTTFPVMCTARERDMRALRLI